MKITGLHHLVRGSVENCNHSPPTLHNLYLSPLYRNSFSKTSNALWVMETLNAVNGYKICSQAWTLLFYVVWDAIAWANLVFTSGCNIGQDHHHGRTTKWAPILVPRTRSEGSFNISLMYYLYTLVIATLDTNIPFFKCLRKFFGQNCSLNVHWQLGDFPQHLFFFQRSGFAEDSPKTTLFSFIRK